MWPPKAWPSAVPAESLLAPHDFAVLLLCLSLVLLTLVGCQPPYGHACLPCRAYLSVPPNNRM